MPRLPRYCGYISKFNREVDAYIKRCHGNRSCRKLRGDMTRALAMTLFTGKAWRSKVPRGALANLLREIESQSIMDEYKLQRAWYERVVYGTSKGTVTARHKVHRLELKCIEDVWADLRFGLTEYRKAIQDGKNPWRFAVDESHEDITIRLDDRAVGDMLLLAMEAYSVPKGKGTRFTEVYGICLGSTRSEDDRRRGHGRHRSHYIHLRGVRTQIRAEGFANRVDYDLRSIDAQMAVMDYLMLGADIVADFHTHPYEKEEDLLREKGWRYSRADEATMPPWVAQLRAKHFHPRASIIMALTRGKRKMRSPGLIRPNVVRFSIGKYHFYLAAYRICGNRYSERGITLNANALPGV
jgi:hypothetical protein